MPNLGTFNSQTIESLFVEFAAAASGTGSLVGTYASTEILLAKMPSADKVNGFMEDIRGPAGRTILYKLHNIGVGGRANYYKDEYPQTLAVAVIVSKLSSEYASRVLAALQLDFSGIVTHILSMGNVQKGVLNANENTLSEEFMLTLADTRRRDQYEMVADIFNSFDRGTE